MTLRDTDERPQISAPEGAEIVYLGARGTRTARGGDFNEEWSGPMAAPFGASHEAPAGEWHLAPPSTGATAIRAPTSDELTIWGLCGAAFMSLALTWAL